MYFQALTECAETVRVCVMECGIEKAITGIARARAASGQWTRRAAEEE